MSDWWFDTVDRCPHCCKKPVIIRTVKPDDIKYFYKFSCKLVCITSNGDYNIGVAIAKWNQLCRTEKKKKKDKQ